MNATQDAIAIINDLWPERRFPVDPAVVASRLGLSVMEVDLPDNISGALLKEADKDPVIVLSQSDSRNRKRFTCAHEIGHYVKRQVDPEPNDQYEFVDLRGDKAAAGTDEDEIYANQFAAQLLMPEGEVCRLHAEGYPAFRMAVYFGVSGDAMTIRLRKLRLG